MNMNKARQHERDRERAKSEEFMQLPAGQVSHVAAPLAPPVLFHSLKLQIIWQI